MCLMDDIWTNEPFSNFDYLGNEKQWFGITQSNGAVYYGDIARMMRTGDGMPITITINTSRTLWPYYTEIPWTSIMRIERITSKREEPTHG